MLRIREWAFVTVVSLATSAAAAGQTPSPSSDPAAAFFDDTALHSISLSINARDWQNLKIHYLDNDYYPCDFRWRDQVVRNVGIRSRGTGSRSGVKPGLRVDFDRYTSDQKFLGLKSLVLRNDVQDPSTMHERISMLFFGRMGLPASREAHTKFYVNNQYVGLYTTVENVDKAFLKKTYGDEDGWLYKYDYSVGDDPYYLQWRDSDPESYVPSPFKPETHESDPRPEIVRDLIQVINQDSDAIFPTTIARYLDVVQFIKHIAIEIFLGDNDGFNGNFGTNNFYFYRFSDSDLFALIPWDKSNAFLDGPSYPIFHNIYDVPESQRNRLTARVLGFPDLKALFLDTLLDCANALSAIDDAPPGETRGWMEREVEREYAQIRDAALTDPDKPFTNDEFEQEVDNLRSFARQRSDFVRAEVARARVQE